MVDLDLELSRTVEGAPLDQVVAVVALAVAFLAVRYHEELALRNRDPDDLASTGELRVTLEEQRTWLPATRDQPGRWRIDCCAVLQAWGSSGFGVRAVLASEQLLAFLDALLAECAAVGVAYGNDGLPTEGGRG